MKYKEYLIGFDPEHFMANLDELQAFGDNKLSRLDRCIILEELVKLKLEKKGKMIEDEFYDKAIYNYTKLKTYSETLCYLISSYLIFGYRPKTNEVFLDMLRMVPQRDWSLGINKKSFGTWLDDHFSVQGEKDNIQKDIENIEKFIQAQSFNKQQNNYMECVLVDKYVYVAAKS